MFCKNCGANVADTTMFCTTCGNKMFDLNLLYGKLIAEKLSLIPAEMNILTQDFMKRAVQKVSVGNANSFKITFNTNLSLYGYLVYKPATKSVVSFDVNTNCSPVMSVQLDVDSELYVVGASIAIDTQPTNDFIPATNLNTYNQANNTYNYQQQAQPQQQNYQQQNYQQQAYQSQPQVQQPYQQQGVKDGSDTSAMSVLGNILWILFGGLIFSLAWLVAGALWCVTIIGIPLGIQCFKLAKLTLAPFGKEIIYTDNAGKVFLNILWIIFTGLWSALGYFIYGALLCITIIGIPFGKQYFKMAKLIFMPFGAQIV